MKFQGKDLPDEMDIFHKFTQGDRTAFRQLYDHYNRPIAQLIERLVKKPEITEEIIQDVWVSIWHKRDRLQKVETPLNYLKKTAINNAFHHLKNITKDKQAMEQLKNSTPEFHDELQEMVDFKDSERLINQAIAELPEQRRKIWTLSRQQHLSHEEIAKQLGLTKSTVNNQIVSASNHIRQYLENHGTLLALAALFLFLKD